MRTKHMLPALLALLVCSVMMCSSLMFAGTVTGKVTYTGTPAHQKPIDMCSDHVVARMCQRHEHVGFDGRLFRPAPDVGEEALEGADVFQVLQLGDHRSDFSGAVWGARAT